MFPNNFKFKESYPFNQQYGMAMDVVQRARKALRDENIPREVDGVRKAWSAVHAARVADHSVNTRDTFKVEIQNQMGIPV